MCLCGLISSLKTSDLQVCSIKLILLCQCVKKYTHEKSPRCLFLRLNSPLIGKNHDSWWHVGKLYLLTFPLRGHIATLNYSYLSVTCRAYRYRIRTLIFKLSVFFHAFGFVRKQTFRYSSLLLLAVIYLLSLLAIIMSIRLTHCSRSCLSSMVW